MTEKLSIPVTSDQALTLERMRVEKGMPNVSIESTDGVWSLVFFYPEKESFELKGNLK
jgi:hypothetical protein